MFSSTTLSLAFSALLLSASANPVHLSKRAGGLTCPADPAFDEMSANAKGQPMGNLQQWCTSPATSITCNALGEKVYGEGAVKDPSCDKCTCPSPPSTPKTPSVPSTPSTWSLVCPKDEAFEEAANNAITNRPIGNLQQWCSSPATSITCRGKEKVYGEGAVKDASCDKCFCTNGLDKPDFKPVDPAAKPAAPNAKPGLTRVGDQVCSGVLCLDVPKKGGAAANV